MYTVLQDRLENFHIAGISLSPSRDGTSNLLSNLLRCLIACNECFYELIRSHIRTRYVRTQIMIDHSQTSRDLILDVYSYGWSSSAHPNQEWVKAITRDQLGSMK